jgi:Transposase IS66 family
MDSYVLQICSPPTPRCRVQGQGSGRLLERGRVPDGGSIAGAIDYSLNSWTALTRHLEDGAVPIDNNFIERQIKPWAMACP